jgi:ssDNA-binding replication factor A large subunit
MRPGMKNLTCTFIALQRGATSKTKDGNTVVQYLVADSSGSIQASLWDEKGEALQPGEIFRIKGGFVSLFQSPFSLFKTLI